MNVMNRIPRAALRGLILTTLILLALMAACHLGRPEGDFTPTAGQPSTAGEQTGSSAGPTNTDGADVIYIPPTTFVMGASAGDSQAGDDEQPAHQVSLDGFYIYAREVTNRMYAECVRAGACFPVQPLPNGPTSHYNDPAYADYPVVGVDWNMARDYCRWAGGRLPTEAEWELAARGVEGYLYPWGNEPAPSCDRLNMFGCLVPPDTRPVGSYPLGVSPFGLFDLAGNVWEWVNDWYDADYYTASAVSNPLGPSAPPDGQYPLKVVRGGSWNSYPNDVRAAARAWANPYAPYDDLGFRCVAQTEAWPAGLTLPDDQHAVAFPFGPDQMGAVVGGDRPNDLGLFFDGLQVTCPDADGIVRLMIHFSGNAPQIWVEGSLSGVGAETIPCVYFPNEQGGGWLMCAGEASQIYVNPQGNYEVQICFRDRDSGQFLGCTNWMPVLAPVCPESGGGVEQCSVSCRDDGSVDLSCSTDDPNTIAWVENEWQYVTEGGRLLQNCASTIAADQATITCTGNFIEPIGGEYVFLFCSADTCMPMSVPVPPDCLPTTGWSLGGYGCRNEDSVFVTVDTGIPNLPDVLGSYNVCDDENCYHCDFVALDPQRIYCYADEPTRVSPIRVCLAIGSEQFCETFVLSDYLPCPAQPGEQPEESQQPEQPQPTDPCNQYNTPESCKDHSLPPERCAWINGACRTQP
ncbi:MAG: formylglycine-generating enzyme family protein [Anaerolineales bacterium]